MPRSRCNTPIALQDETGGKGRYVVYGLVDPRDGLVHYVGRTQNLRARLSAHLSARNDYGGGGSRAKRDWISSLVAAGLRPSARILHSSDDFDEIERVEAEWQTRGRAEGWPLTNGKGMASVGGVPASVRAKREAA